MIRISPQGECLIEGTPYPAVGFGTFPLRGRVCEEAVSKAINAGYRIFDTATMYQNFEPIAKAMRSHDQSHFYLISKVWPPNHTPNRLQKISGHHGKTPAQVALRWIIQHGCLPLPGSSNEEHMRQNLALWDFALSPEEMRQINEHAKGGSRRRITPEMRLGFSDEFDYTYEQCWPAKSP